jgi:hypothetical protein
VSPQLGVGLGAGVGVVGTSVAGTGVREAAGATVRGARVFAGLGVGTEEVTVASGVTVNGSGVVVTGTYMNQGVCVALPLSASALGVRVGVGPAPPHAAISPASTPSHTTAIIFLKFTFESHFLSRIPVLVECAVVFARPEQDFRFQILEVGP